MLTVTDDTTKAELAEALANLRERQRRTVLASVVIELSAEMDRLLDAWRVAAN